MPAPANLLIRPARTLRPLRRAIAAAALAIVAAAAPSHAQPGNDQCSNATPLSPCISTPGSNQGAATNGESSCANSVRDVFYSFTPMTSGPFGVLLCDSPFERDFVLSIHTGCPATPNNQIACNDDSCGLLPQIGLVSLAAGQQYYLRVASKAGAAGAAAPFKIEVCGGELGACCVGADCHLKASEKYCSSQKGSKFILGATCTPNPCDKGACCIPPQECRVVAPPVCASSNGNFLGFGTACEPFPCFAPPPNDDCPNATPVPVPVSIVADNLTAIPDGAVLPPCDFADPAGVWFRFLTPSAGLYRVDTEGSPSLLDTTLKIFASCTGALIACDDDGGSGYLSSIDLQAAAGNAFLVRVAGFGRTRGVFRLNINPVTTGACCLGSTCQLLPQADCAGPNSRFAGLGTVCPLPGSSTGACCPADFNQSGAISVQDLFDFLAAYFTGNPAADYNGSGSLSVQDLFDFLAGYFQGC